MADPLLDKCVKGRMHPYNFNLINFKMAYFWPLFTLACLYLVNHNMLGSQIIKYKIQREVSVRMQYKINQLNLSNSK